LQLGGRRRGVARVRAKLAQQLVGDYGISLAAAARRLGVSTSGIARVLERASGK
jgi:predicted transcriptional regulator